MPVQDSLTEVTFYYINGETESFDIPVSSEVFAEQLPELLSQPWIILHLFDQTVLVFTAQVIKVEIKPPIPEISGQGVFPNCQRVTALTRGAKA